MVFYEQLILRDVFTVALIALVLGLSVHSVLRRKNPEKAWGARGNVWTQPFGGIDLPVVAALLVMFGVAVWSGEGSGAQSGQSAEAPEFGTQDAWFGIVLYVFLLASLLFFLGFVRLRNVVEVFGLARMGPLKILLVSAGAMLLVFPVVLFVLNSFNALVLKDAFGELEPQEVVRVFFENSNPHLRILLVISTCLVAPVAEEFIFRGYIYAVVKRFSDQTFSAIFTSAVFAVVHMNVLSLAPLFALAMCFTLAYELTGCLWIPIAMHAIFNTVNVSLILSMPDLM